MTRQAVELLDPVAAAYLQYCVDEGAPANTIRRRRALLKGVGNPSTATRSEVEAWWASRRHLKDTTRANDLALLKSFYKWCAIWEHRVDDPTARLVAPKLDAGAPRPISLVGVHHVLDQIATLTEDAAPLRRGVRLGQWAGLRRAEAARLNWDNLDLEARMIWVRGKGGKIRQIPLSIKLLDELGPERPSCNVITGTADGWTPDTFGRKINEQIRAAGVDATFHKFRHRFGTLAYQRSKDPKAVAELMGHASVDTVMRYYALAADDAARNITDMVTDD